MAFEKSEYPKKMLESISRKVLNMRRQLERPETVNEDSASKPILIVSCHGSDDKLVKSIKANEEELLKTEAFKNTPKPVFQFVKKTASNVGSKLSVLKSIALGKKSALTPALSTKLSRGLATLAFHTVTGGIVEEATKVSDPALGDTCP